MSQPARTAAQPARLRVLIRPGQGRFRLGLPELWERRELLYFLVWRDVKVRYKQTLLGAGWAVAQPFLTMVVFSVFFGRLAKVSSEGVPYPIFAYSALVPWSYFSAALAGASGSLVGNQHLLSKVHFPRLLVPLAAVASPLLDFAVAFAVLVAMMIGYGYWPTPAALSLPLFAALAGVAALGAGLWLGALNVAYRDVRHVIPFVAQVWMFLSPVVYSASLVPRPWRILYALNPMAGVIEGFRWALLGAGDPPWAAAAASALGAVAMLAGGLAYFRRMEGTFADVF